jgi:hypothetical protein
MRLKDYLHNINHSLEMGNQGARSKGTNHNRSTLQLKMVGSNEPINGSNPQEKNLGLWLTLPKRKLFPVDGFSNMPKTMMQNSSPSWLLEAMNKKRR